MTNNETWQAVLAELELSISKANFNTWFKNTGILEKKDGQAIIVAGRCSRNALRGRVRPNQRCVRPGTAKPSFALSCRLNRRLRGCSNSFPLSF